MFIDDRFKAAIKAYMSDQNITQKELAERFGISAMTVSRWMSGRTERMAPEVWSKLESSLGEYLSVHTGGPGIISPVPIEELEEEDVVGQSMAVESLLLPGAGEQTRVFKFVDRYDNSRCEKIVICECVEQPSENQYLFMLVDGDPFVGWCEAVTTDKCFIVGEDKETARVFAFGSWDFMGVIIEIRIRHFDRE